MGKTGDERGLTDSGVELKECDCRAEWWEWEVDTVLQGCAKDALPTDDS
ncbi:hypothetical protein M5D96_012926 [Drosophila gunungcola]|uniref:Uncharacterized protein n=1 Tax=Drosophila gunungcola TaxID=103775 RepID=A0A9P9YCP0_9MUSC|nr:hypothetical protein M5D96_012926 [Drosophila gunungcola]